MEKWSVLFIGALIMSFFATSCSKKSASTVDNKDNPISEKTLLLGNFSADSAYKYIERQVAFGPRVPGTPAHDSCAQYIVDELKRIGVDTMHVQKGEVVAFNGDVLPITNIICGINPPGLRRVLLVAHYDTRPWADNEDSDEDRARPVLGANDGGSGVGVLLEIARNLMANRPSVGVDLLFVDAEDYGDVSGFGENSDTWCLGSQYWVKNMVPYTRRNLPVYGILLDMVGGKGARFHHEYFSKQNAPSTAFKIWGEAKRLGYDDVFVNKLGGAVTDDHIVITNAGIPTVDIIECNNEVTGTFAPTWHTLDDNMSNIDKATLKAVGETVLNVIYKEKAY